MTLKPLINPATFRLPEAVDAARVKRTEMKLDAALDAIVELTDRLVELEQQVAALSARLANSASPPEPLIAEVAAFEPRRQRGRPRKIAP